MENRSKDQSEAAEIGRQYGLDNLCAIVDVNRLGQSDPTAGMTWMRTVPGGQDSDGMYRR